MGIRDPDPSTRFSKLEKILVLKFWKNFGLAKNYFNIVT